jgi:hypothetical protein
MLLEPRPHGPILGTYAGQPISAGIVDADGERYAYAGVAPRLPSGRYDLEALHADEWLVEPGLIYSGNTRPEPKGKSRSDMPASFPVDAA